MKDLERLERAIAHQGLASRREAKALIIAGLVKVNDKVITEPGFGIVVDKDKIEIKGDTQGVKESVLVYKPRGIETSKTLAKNKDLHDYFPALKHLSPIGRLDKESEGLIILSNDGVLTRALTQENSQVAKTYKVTVQENVSDSALQKMSAGIMLDGVKTKPAQAIRMSRYAFTIVLHEGRKHQIRRMCAACHLTVTQLTRIKIGHFSIGTMKPGAAKILTAKDVASLKV